jgi:nucleoid DNA-binding protein|tara:strand:- start:2170 stop:2388 length:219 start_codon:yes stop_codon:yes gene_type:complete
VKTRDELIYALANKYDLPISRVEEIVSFQFKFVAKVMKLGKFEAVRLPYFGKFSAKKERIKHMNRITDESKR